MQQYALVCNIKMWYYSIMEILKRHKAFFVRGVPLLQTVWMQRHVANKEMWYYSIMEILKRHKAFFVRGVPLLHQCRPAVEVASPYNIYGNVY